MCCVLCVCISYTHADMKSMIVKVVDVKQEYKNGNGGREATNMNNMNGSHPPPPVSNQAAAEQNNT